jgi:hypothetical protein
MLSGLAARPSARRRGKDGPFRDFLVFIDLPPV